MEREQEFKRSRKMELETLHDIYIRRDEYYDFSIKGDGLRSETVLMGTDRWKELTKATAPFVELKRIAGWTATDLLQNWGRELAENILNMLYYDNFAGLYEVTNDPLELVGEQSAVSLAGGVFELCIRVKIIDVRPIPLNVGVS